MIADAPRDREPGAGEPRPRRRGPGPLKPLARLLPTVAVVLVCTGLLAWMQFSFTGMVDSDSYFHTRAARELDLHGMRSSFPQTVFSTWSRRYSDKDWLFHVFLIPFQRLGLRGAAAAAEPAGGEDLVAPGKAAMIVLYLGYFSALAFCLRAVRARHPWFWLTLYFSSLPFMIWGLLPVRPGTLGALFLLLEIALIVRGGGPWLGVAGALHAYSHSSFVLLPAIAAAALVARFLRREPLPRRTFAWSLAGPIFALIVNPYFPNNVTVAWDQLVGVAMSVWARTSVIPLELFGAELRGLSTSDVLYWASAFLPALGGLLGFLAGPRRLSTDGLALTLMAGQLLVAGLLSYRFMNFFLPVVIVLGARLWSEWAGEESLGALARRDARTFTLAAGLVGGSLALGLLSHPVAAVRRDLAGTITDVERQRPAIAFLRQVAPPEELVYHNFWFAFSALYHFRPAGRYVEALDPVFFQRFDPALFEKAVDMMRGSAPDAHEIIARDFGARWVYVTVEDDARFVATLLRDSRFRNVYRDDEALIFHVE